MAYENVFFCNFQSHTVLVTRSDLLPCKCLHENQTLQLNQMIKTIQALKATTAAATVLGTTCDQAPSEMMSTYFPQDKIYAIVDWINLHLLDDPDVMHKLPIAERRGDLFTSIGDGIILCKLINISVPGTIDERAINKDQLNETTIIENMTLAINSASSIGCYMVKIRPQDLAERRPLLVLSFLWQVVKVGLFSEVSVKNCPSLLCLLKDGEDLSDLMAMIPQEVLLRWLNYHLENAGSGRRVECFPRDIMDSECYAILLSRIADKLPPSFSYRLPYLRKLPLLIKQLSLNTRANLVLKSAEELHCATFMRSVDIVTGNSPLNFAFLASLFKTHPTLEPLEEMLPDFEESREEKTFRNWMNSLGVTPVIYDLNADLHDGYAIIQVLDKVKPGSVDWSKVNKPPFNATGDYSERLANWNYQYAVKLGMSMEIFVIGRISDLLHSRKRTRVILWNLLLKYSVTRIQKTCQVYESIDNRAILDWVNRALNRNRNSVVKSISDFSDPLISTSWPIIDIINEYTHEKVDYPMAASRTNDSSCSACSEQWDYFHHRNFMNDKSSNARLAISMARKIGVCLYAQPEDLLEVHPKMAMVVFTCLMTHCKLTLGDALEHLR